MKQEDLELVKKDFSARVLHGVKFITWKEGYEGSGISLSIDDAVGIIDDIPSPLIVGKNGSYDIRNCRAYLRKLSSMTEEEYKELKSISPYYGFAPYEYIGDWCPNYEMVDWCNKKGFDYRGLIEKHLAIELTEENLSISEIKWDNHLDILK